jgi:CHAT domain
MAIKKVLILAANPLETARLRLDKEVEEIRMTLQLSPNRDRFVIESHGAVRPQDLHTYLHNLNPQILHFSGHGGGDRGLAFEDEDGGLIAVSTLALVNLFKLFANQIQCVVLNACYSEEQARAIAQHIPYVIGMNQDRGYSSTEVCGGFL